MIRFNTDSGHLEYYTGTHWVDVITNNNELGDHNNTNSTGGTGHSWNSFGGGSITIKGSKCYRVYNYRNTWKCTRFW